MRDVPAGDRLRVFLGSKAPPQDWARPNGRLASTMFSAKLMRLQWPLLGATRSEIRWGWALAGFMTFVLVGGLFTNPWYLRVSDAVLIVVVLLPWLIRLTRWMCSQADLGK